MVGVRKAARVPHELEVVCRRGFAERDLRDGERGRGTGREVWEHWIMEAFLTSGRSL